MGKVAARLSSLPVATARALGMGCSGSQREVIAWPGRRESSSDSRQTDNRQARTALAVFSSPSLCFVLFCSLAPVGPHWPLAFALGLACAIRGCLPPEICSVSWPLSPWLAFSCPTCFPIASCCCLGSSPLPAPPLPPFVRFSVPKATLHAVPCLSLPGTPTIRAWSPTRAQYSVRSHFGLGGKSGDSRSQQHSNPTFEQ